jgi:hypothetical protein
MAIDCSWCQYLNRSKTRRMKDDKSTDNIDDSPFIRSDVRCPHPKMRCHQQLIDCERVLNTLVHSIRSFEKLFDCCGCQRLRPRVQDDPHSADPAGCVDGKLPSAVSTTALHHHFDHSSRDTCNRMHILVCQLMTTLSLRLDRLTIYLFVSSFCEWHTMGQIFKLRLLPKETCNQAELGHHVMRFQYGLQCRP